MLVLVVVVVVLVVVVVVVVGACEGGCTFIFVENGFIAGGSIQIGLEIKRTHFFSF